MSLYLIIERRVTEIGEYVDGQQWLTLDCGHRDLHDVDIASWKVGEIAHCVRCNKLAREVGQEIFERLTREINLILDRIGPIEETPE